jgi:hypothetical protein
MMTDTPFWKRTPADPECEPQTSAEPANTDDVLIINGHEFRWTEGVRAKIQYQDSDGHDVGSVYIPYDPDNQPSEEDVLTEADRLFHDMEHLRSVVNREAIDRVVGDLHKPGTAGEQAFAELMVETVADALRGSLKLTVTDDDGREGLTPEQLDALAAEGERLFDERLPQLVRGIAETEVDGLTFWQTFARDIIATATLHARDDVAEDWGGQDAVEALDDDAFAAFEERVHEAYATGPYIAGAWLMLWREWLQTLGELVGNTMTALAESEESESITESLIKAARKSLGMPEPATSSETPPTFTPAFDDAGLGRADNSVVSIGARHMLSAPVARWQKDVEAWPVFAHENGSGKALYSPSRSHFPTARDAMRAVESYSPAHVAMLRYITALHIANNTNKTSGPYGGFYVSIDDFLGVVGRAKHAKGGYRPEDRREVVELIEALQRIEVTGSVEGYERGKRGKKSQLTIRSPLIVVSQTIMQKGMPGSEERPVAWYLRAGDWAAELERFGLQYAVMTKALLQLNTQNDMHAFHLGNVLTEQYRIRANQQSWKQPYRVCKLLADAEIDVDRKNPGRFRKRIEAALDVLSNPVDMQGMAIIESWHYSTVVEAKGRGWLDRWLDTGITITPPASLIRPYQDIGRRRRAPKKLAG